MALVKASLDAMLEKYRLDAIVYLSVPTAASPIQPPANPQPVKPGDTAFDLANLSGYPDLVVPAGMTPNGLPVSVSFSDRPSARRGCSATATTSNRPPGHAACPGTRRCWPPTSWCRDSRCGGWRASRLGVGEHRG